MAEEEGNPVEQDDPEELEGEETEGEQEETGSEDPAAILAERDKLRRTLKRVKDEKAKLVARLKPAEEEQPKGDPDAKVKRLAAVASLTGEGLSKAQAKLAVRLLDLDSVEVDEDGDIDISDQLDELKEALPGLFAPAAEAGTGRPRKVATASRDRRTPGNDDPTSRTSDALLRAAGYR